MTSEGRAGARERGKAEGGMGGQGRLISRGGWESYVRGVLAGLSLRHSTRPPCVCVVDSTKLSKRGRGAKRR